MELEFIHAGQIVNTHGVRGEVKLLPQGVEAEVIAKSKTVYIDGQPIVPRTRRIHKGCVLLTLPGVEDMDAAIAMKNKTVTLRRKDLKLPKGYFFDQELIGVTAYDAATGQELGKVEEVMDYPAHKVYAVRGGKDEYLIPAVPAFVQSVDVAAGRMEIHVWEGLGSHEN